MQARFKEAGDWAASEPSNTLTVTTAPSVTLPTGVTATYGDMLEDAKNFSAPWTWVSRNDVVGDVGDQPHQAYIEVPAPGDNVTWTGLPAGCSYSSQTPAGLRCGVTVTVGAADSVITLHGVPGSKTFDDLELGAPTATVTKGDTTTPESGWYVKGPEGNFTEWKAQGSEQNPKHAGTYKFRAYVDPSTNFKEATQWSDEIIISPATNKWVDAPSVQGWTYGGTASQPSFEAQFGTSTAKVCWQRLSAGTGAMLVTNPDAVDCTGLGTDSGSWDAPPTQAGNYRLFVTIPNTGDYAELTGTADFTISKAGLSVTVEEITGRPYDSQVQGNPDVTVVDAKTGARVAADPEVMWQAKHEGSYSEAVKTAPSAAGTYRAVVTASTKDGNYEPKTVESNDFTIQAVEPSVKVAIADQSYTGVVVAEDAVQATVTGVGTEKPAGKVTYAWQVKNGDSWKDTTRDQVVNVGTYRVTAHIDQAGNYTEATSKPVEFEVTPVAPTVTVAPIDDRAYTESPDINATVTVTGVKGEVVKATPELVWQVKDGSNWKTVKQSEVKAAGTYRVTAKVDAAGNYAEAESKPVQFQITQAKNGWSTTPSLENGTTEWVTGDPAPEVNLGESTFGTPEVHWATKDGEALEAVPTKPGEYVVTVKVGETASWEPLSQEFGVKILPIPPAKDMTLTDANGAKVLERYVGDKATVSVDGVYVPANLADDPEVTFTLHSTPIELGKAKVEDGKASLEFTVPDVELGDHTITATLGGYEIGKVDLRVVAKPTPTSPNQGAASGKSSLARTGAAALPYLLTATLLVGTSTLVLRLRRRES